MDATMPKVKAITAMKERLQQALSSLAEQEEVINLVKEVIEKYGLEPGDLFSEDALGSAMEPEPVDPGIPYCDRAGNTWSGKGRRPTWLNEAILAGAALEDFRNPAFSA